MMEKKTGKPRTSRALRVEGLRRRAEFERDTLAREVAGLKGAIAEKRARWKTASWILGIAAVAWTVGVRLFGKNSISARIGRLTSVAQVLFGLGKAVGRVKKFR